MDDDSNPLQRMGGHLAVLAVIALLFIGARSLWISDVLGYSISRTSDNVDDETFQPEPLTEFTSLEESEDFIFDTDAVPILINSNFSPNLYPKTYEGIKPHHDLISYTVQPKDTPIGIAEKFDISPETILGGNSYLSEESSAPQAGETLVILPIDGVLHDVAEGETLEGLSEQYGIAFEEIVTYRANNLEFPYRLYPGTQIMIPGAVREVFVWSAPSLPSRPSSSDSTGSGIAPLVQGTGVFIWPVGNRRITQHYWYGHGAIDIGSPEGSAVIASDTGTVTWAGWNVYGYGNLIVVNHGNGYETYYAHLSNISVVPGQVVNQGQYIGASGNTGRSSGAHLHFEVRYFNSMLEPISILR